MSVENIDYQNKDPETLINELFAINESSIYDMQRTGNGRETYMNIIKTCAEKINTLDPRKKDEIYRKITNKLNEILSKVRDYDCEDLYEPALLLFEEIFKRDRNIAVLISPHTWGRFDRRCISKDDLKNSSGYYGLKGQRFMHQFGNMFKRTKGGKIKRSKGTKRKRSGKKSKKSKTQYKKCK